MLDTFAELHLAFLDGIKKEYTGTVTPVVFERIWNQWAQPRWIADCVSMKEGVESTEKKINDLQVIRREYVYNPVGTNLFTIPDGTTADENAVVTPKHMRTLSVMFKVNYSLSPDQECSLTGISDWIEAYIMRSDQKSYAMKSAFRRPKDSRLYYDKVNNQIRMLTDPVNGSPAVKMDIEYLMYPNEISSNPLDPVSILSDYAKQEIVQLCVKTYLEKVKDQRTSSFIQGVMSPEITKI